MAKKEKIVLQMSPDMEVINGDLTTAMDTLDATIARVGEVLKGYEGMQFTAADEPGAEPAAVAPDAAPANPDAVSEPSPAAETPAP